MYRKVSRFLAIRGALGQSRRRARRQEVFRLPAGGRLAALDAIKRATGEAEANVIGYCIGGTLTASALAYMATTNARRIASATFFTSLLDFADVGDISVFLDDAQLKLADEHMNRLGYLEGHHMAEAFNLLRENDLIWFFVVNNYLMGRDPAAFNLLYWNSDSTRMPANMHSFYLRNMYYRNVLKNAGGIKLAGPHRSAQNRGPGVLPVDA